MSTHCKLRMCEHSGYRMFTHCKHTMFAQHHLDFCPIFCNDLFPLTDTRHCNFSRVDRSFPGGGPPNNGAVKRRTRIPVVKTRWSRACHYNTNINSVRSSNSAIEAQQVYKESVGRKKSQRRQHVSPFNNIKMERY